jgi:hypothetical protein
MYELFELWNIECEEVYGEPHDLTDEEKEVLYNE